MGLNAFQIIVVVVDLNRGVLDVRFIRSAVPLAGSSAERHRDGFLGRRQHYALRRPGSYTGRCGRAARFFTVFRFRPSRGKGRFSLATHGTRITASCARCREEGRMPKQIFLLMSRNKPSQFALPTNRLLKKKLAGGFSRDSLASVSFGVGRCAAEM
ncbi:hypothetical protein [Sinorhizobium meliloti]|uniref:hypothetical protein n=1 Tax=Rhizobium meliloti TaxID=382 RepID=UPI003EB82B4E